MQFHDKLAFCYNIFEQGEIISTSIIYCLSFLRKDLMKQYNQDKYQLLTKVMLGRLDQPVFLPTIAYQGTCTFYFMMFFIQFFYCFKRWPHVSY